MAVYRPLKRVGSDIQVMTEAEYNLIIDEVIRLYGTNPGVQLSVTSDSAAGSYETKLGTLIEYRLQAGSAYTSSSPLTSPTGLTDPPVYLPVSYGLTLQTLTWQSSFPYKDRPGSVYANHSHPVQYYGPGNSIQPGSWYSFYETFIAPALIRLATGTSISSAEHAGTYFISTSQSETDATLISSTPIFTDTVSDYAAFASGSLPEALDQPDASTTPFYLHRVDPLSQADFPLPLVLWGPDNQLKTIDRSVFQQMLLDFVRYWSVDFSNLTSTAIRYQYGSSAYLTTNGLVSRGTGLTDTYTSTYTERLDQNAPNPNATVYYAQNVPTASATVQTTKYLGIGLF